MKRAYGVLVTLFLAAMFSSSTATARPIRRLQRMVAEEMTRVSGALAADDSATTETAWTVTNMYLRVLVPVGFTLPFVTTLTVVPQIEMVWHRTDAVR